MMFKIFGSFAAGYFFCKFGGWEMFPIFFHWLGDVFYNTLPYIDSLTEELRVFFTGLFDKIFR